MSDRRKHLRLDVAKEGRLSFNGSGFGCIVRNISPDGASIEVTNASYLPERFELMVTSEPARQCRLVWVKPDRVGVAFEGQ